MYSDTLLAAARNSLSLSLIAQYNLGIARRNFRGVYKVYICALCGKTEVD